MNTRKVVVVLLVLAVVFSAITLVMNIVSPGFSVIGGVGEASNTSGGSAGVQLVVLPAEGAS